MIERMIKIGVAWDSRKVKRAIESAAKSRGLVTSLNASLDKYTGCVHWHFKMPGKSGTIEATMWPRQRCAWLSVQSGRHASWIDPELRGLQRDLNKRLRQKTEH